MITLTESQPNLLFVARLPTTRFTGKDCLILRA